MDQQPWQVLATCPHCRVEASVVQLMDPTHPATHLGRPTDQRCRLCGWATRALDEPFAPRMPPSAGRCPACNKALSEAARTGRGICPHCRYTPRLLEVHAPMRLGSAAVALGALQRWALEDGEQDVERFCQAHMGLGAEAVVERLVRHEPVSTTFDVIAWLFPDGSALSSTPDEGPSARPVPIVDRAPAAPPSPSPSPTSAALDPRVPARVLVSVMAADGLLRPGERRFVDAFLAHEGLEPLDPADLRIWRPHELPVPEDADLRARLLEACVHLMHLDHQRDGSEWKVIKAFAAAWGIAEDDLDTWDRSYDARYATVMSRLWRSLTNLVRLR